MCLPVGSRNILSSLLSITSFYLDFRDRVPVGFLKKGVWMVSINLDPTLSNCVRDKSIKNYSASYLLPHVSAEFQDLERNVLVVFKRHFDLKAARIIIEPPPIDLKLVKHHSKTFLDFEMMTIFLSFIAKHTISSFEGKSIISNGFNSKISFLIDSCGSNPQSEN